MLIKTGTTAAIATAAIVAISTLSNDAYTNAFAPTSRTSPFRMTNYGGIPNKWKEMSTSGSSSSSLQMALSMPTWRGNPNRTNDHKSHRLFSKQRSISTTIAKILTKIQNTKQTLRRTTAIILTSTFLLLTSLTVTPPPSAHASSSTAAAASSPTTTTMTDKSRQKLDKIIHKYVRDRMFNDDAFDPFESAYREISADLSSGTYASSLGSTASSVLPQNSASVANSVIPSSRSTFTNEEKLLSTIMKFVDKMNDSYGVPKNISYLLITGAAFLVPGALIGMLLMTFSYSQRAMTEKMAVQRYGSSVLDANEYKGALDDDDDEEDDEDDDDEDDDVEDDDDDDDDDE